MSGLVRLVELALDLIGELDEPEVAPVAPGERRREPAAHRWQDLS